MNNPQAYAIENGYVTEFNLMHNYQYLKILHMYNDSNLQEFVDNKDIEGLIKYCYKADYIRNFEISESLNSYLQQMSGEFKDTEVDQFFFPFIFYAFQIYYYVSHWETHTTTQTQYSYSGVQVSGYPVTIPTIYHYFDLKNLSSEFNDAYDIIIEKEINAYIE